LKQLVPNDIGSANHSSTSDKIWGQREQECRSPARRFQELPGVRQDEAFLMEHVLKSRPSTA
jgi:hypothetical protein